MSLDFEIINTNVRASIWPKSKGLWNFNKTGPIALALALGPHNDNVHKDRHYLKYFSGLKVLFLNQRAGSWNGYFQWKINILSTHLCDYSIGEKVQVEIIWDFTKYKRNKRYLVLNYYIFTLV